MTELEANAHAEAALKREVYLKYGKRLDDVRSAVIEAARRRHEAESGYWDAASRGSRCAEEQSTLQQANCDLRSAMLELIEMEGNTFE